MLAHCLRRWPNIISTLGQRLVFAGDLSSISILYSNNRILLFLASLIIFLLHNTLSIRQSAAAILIRS